MTTSDILKRSWHNIGRAKVRVGLTAAALAVGAATMTLALAITQGAQDSIEKGFGNFKNTFVSVEGFTAKNTSDTGVQTTEDAKKATEAISDSRLGIRDAEKMKSLDGVKQVIPLSFYLFDDVIINGQSYKAPSVVPYTPIDTLDQIVAGKVEDLKGDSVVVPERYARQAGVANPKDFVGHKLTFVHAGTRGFFGRPGVPDKEVTLTVVAVTKSSADNQDAGAELAYIPAEKMSALAQEDAGAKRPEDIIYNQIVLVTDEAQTETIKDTLKNQGYDAKTRQDSIGEALNSVTAVRTALLIFAGVAIFTAIFGVINTQLMSVLERTREIGIMKALGLSRSGVLLMFSIEAGWIGFIGSIAGTLLAIPFTLLIGSLAGPSFSVPITPLNFLIVVVVLVVIAMASGFLPARRAAKLDPVEALRSE